MRRILLVNPTLTLQELHGLAYRLKLLTRNKSLSSILIGNNVTSHKHDVLLPTILSELDDDYDEDRDDDTIPQFSNGYDVLNYPSTYHRRLLEGLQSLALAVNGNNDTNDNTCIPTISVPHGHTTDGGYAFLMATHVLTTQSSTYQILNPSRGLSFDPIGLSYMLPRLGWEYDQPCAEYPTGTLLALTKYTANGEDMVETGLATHYLQSIHKMGSLERALGELKPWENQGLYKPSSRLYTGERTGFLTNKSREIMNVQYHNVAVCHLLHGCCVYDAAGQEIVLDNEDIKHPLQWAEDKPGVIDEYKDCSLFYGERRSRMVDVAATFSEIFQEPTVIGMMERLREVAHSSLTEVLYEDDVDAREIAKELVSDMESQCPLALRVVHALMQLGARDGETLESCMEREMAVQLKLMEGQDYQNWCQSQRNTQKEGCSWKHESVTHVRDVEIEELLG